MTRRLLPALSLVLCVLRLAGAAAAEPAAAARPAPLQVSPVIRGEGNDLRVGAKGTAQLPDGAVLQLAFVGLAEEGAPPEVVCRSRAEVTAGAFSMPPWSVQRDALKAVRYRIEARLVDPQPPQVERRMSRAALRWSAAADLSFGNWRSLCSQLAPTALALRERLAAVVRHREELLGVAKQVQEKRLARSAWKLWRASSTFARDREQCIQALDQPAAALNFPRACDRAREVLAQYDILFNALDLENMGRMTPESKVAMERPEMNFRLDAPTAFESQLAAECFRRLAEAVDKVARGINPGTAEQPRQPTAPAIAGSAPSLAEISDRAKEVRDVPWTVDVQERHILLLEAINASRRFLDELGRSDKPDDPVVQARRLERWSDVRRRLDSLLRTLGA